MSFENPKNSNTDSLAVFLKNHTASPPRAPDDEFLNIQKRIRDERIFPFDRRRRVLRPFVGAALVIVSFVLSFNLVPTGLPSISSPVLTASSGVAPWVSDDELGNFLEESLSALDDDKEWEGRLERQEVIL